MSPEFYMAEMDRLSDLLEAIEKRDLSIEEIRELIASAEEGLKTIRREAARP